MSYTTEHTVINRRGIEETILTHITFGTDKVLGHEYVQVEYEVKGQGVRYGRSCDFSSKRIAELKARVS